MTGTIDPARFGMPDATTAGVPAGTTLTAYVGPMTITTPGTVIEGKIIDGTLQIEADNVTIKNCVIKNYGMWGVDGGDAANLTVQNCDFTASTSKDTNAAILGQGTFIGNDISQSENGIVLTAGASVVRDNYIHDLFDNFGEPHIDGISVQGGQNHVLIEHNTIESWDTSGIFIKNDFGPINDITVRNNLIYGDQDRGDPAAAIYVYGPNTTNVSITNNYVEKGNWYYYATSNANPTISGNIEWNNKTDPIPYPNSAPTTLSAPIIAAFSTDTGVAGDYVTSDSTLTLTGTAPANSTVKFYDGSTQIGTTTANSSGSWTYTTTALSDTAHKLTATATNSSGQTSAASTALTVTVDTKAPAAPTIGSNTVNSANQVVLSGNAEANSTIKVYDGTTQVGTATTNSSGAWTLTTSALSTGSHTLTAKATDAAGNASAASSAVNPVISSGSTGSVATPVISSFSTDSGASDGITNDNTLQLKGTAVANSTVTIYDGSNKIGTTTADSSGAWSYTTQALTDASHTLKATATSSGQTSAASTALVVTVDTTAPAAPAVTGESVNSANQVVLSGTAEANSAIKVYEGTTQIGTATTNSSGAWSVTTSALSNGSHVLTATATDVAGNASAGSTAVDPVIGSPPAVPTISSFSTDTGTAGDRITSDNTLTLSGTAPAQSTVKVYDGSTQIGTVTAGATGAWTYTTAALSNGTHSLTATDTVSGVTSAASAALAVTVDTSAPNAPTLSSGSVLFGRANVSGKAEAGSTVKVYDGTTLLGSTKAGTDGSWSLAASDSKSGAHTFVATATDVAGNSSALSQSFAAKSGWQGLKAFGSSSKAATTTATADQSQVKMAAVSSADAGASSQVDSTTKVATTSSTEAVVSSSSSTLAGATSNSIVGKGGADTFVFASNFGHDTTNGLTASAPSHDTIKAGGSVFDSFASVLSQAAQSGHDAAVSTGSDTFVLKNTKLDVLNHQDFHFA